MKILNLGDGGNHRLANAVKDSHQSRFPEIRFKPKDWLVVPISTPEANLKKTYASEISLAVTDPRLRFFSLYSLMPLCK